MTPSTGQDRAAPRTEAAVLKARGYLRRAADLVEPSAEYTEWLTEGPQIVASLLWQYDHPASRLTPPGDRDPAGTEPMDHLEAVLALNPKAKVSLRAFLALRGDRDRREARLIEALRDVLATIERLYHPDIGWYVHPAYMAAARLVDGAAPGQAGPPESGDSKP